MLSSVTTSERKCECLTFLLSVLVCNDAILNVSAHQSAYKTEIMTQSTTNSIWCQNLTTKTKTLPNSLANLWKVILSYVKLAWCWEREGWLIWPYYVFPIIRWPGFMIITPSFSPFSTVFSNQQLQLYHRWWICKALIRLFLWKWSSRWTLRSAVTFAAVLLWYIDKVLLADDVLPWCVHVIITLETAALDTPNKVAVLVTDAPTKCTPTICPLWESEKSPILHYFHTNCYWTQSVMHWHWHYTAQTNKRIMKDTHN